MEGHPGVPQGILEIARVGISKCEYRPREVYKPVLQYRERIVEVPPVSAGPSQESCGLLYFNVEINKQCNFQTRSWLFYFNVEIQFPTRSELGVRLAGRGRIAASFAGPRRALGGVVPLEGDLAMPLPLLAGTWLPRDLESGFLFTGVSFPNSNA